MNYLSHYYFYKKENNPEYSLGLIFPDLIRGFGRFKVYDYLKFSSNKTASIYAGAVIHLLTDKNFHQSHYFKNFEYKINGYFNDTGFTKITSKCFFVSHILVEMYLDRQLLLYDKNIGFEFYNDLKLVSNDTLKDFLTLLEIQKTDKVIASFNRFIELDFLNSYINNDLFIFSIDKVMSKVGLPQMTTIQKNILNSIIYELDKEKLNIKELKNSFNLKQFQI